MITQGLAVNSEQLEFTAFLINILEPTSLLDFENKIASMSEDELKELYRLFKQAKNLKLTRMAKDGLKFDFLEKYRGKCPDGTEMFMSGGCVKCRDKKNKMTIKNQDGGNIKERFKKGPGDSDSVDNAKPNKKQVKAFKDCNGGKARKNCNGSKMKKRFQQGGGFRILEPASQNSFQSIFSNMLNTKISNKFQEGGVTSTNNSETEINISNPLEVARSFQPGGDVSFIRRKETMPTETESGRLSIKVPGQDFLNLHKNFYLPLAGSIESLDIDNMSSEEILSRMVSDPVFASQFQEMITEAQNNYAASNRNKNLRESLLKGAILTAKSLPTQQELLAQELEEKLANYNPNEQGRIYDTRYTYSTKPNPVTGLVYPGNQHMMDRFRQLKEDSYRVIHGKSNTEQEAIPVPLTKPDVSVKMPIRVQDPGLVTAGESISSPINNSGNLSASLGLVNRMLGLNSGLQKVYAPTRIGRKDERIDTKRSPERQERWHEHLDRKTDRMWNRRENREERRESRLNRKMDRLKKRFS